MPLPIYFAPLQGYTEDAFRRAHHELCGGVDCYYTPFLRLEQGEIRKKDNLSIRPEFNVGVPLAIQVIARDGDELKVLVDGIRQHAHSWGERRAKMLEEGPASTLGWSWPDAERVLVDINMGCPFPMQVNHGRGAGVLAHADKVKEICDVVRLHPDFDYTVKMRLGVEKNDDWRSILPLLNDAPLKHITLHPRVARQLYDGSVDMPSFLEFASSCLHPLVYNGDVTSVEDINRIEQAFPQLKAIMIGRGLLARPTLVKEYKTGISASTGEVISVFKQLHEALYRHYSGTIPGEQQLLNKMRTLWEYAEPTIGRKQWKKIHKAGNLRNYLRAIDEL